MLNVIKITTIIATIKNVLDYFILFNCSNIEQYSFIAYYGYTIDVFLYCLLLIFYCLYWMDGMFSYYYFPVCYSLDEVELQVVKLWFTLIVDLTNSFTQRGLMLSFVDILLVALLSLHCSGYCAEDLLADSHNTTDYYDSIDY